MRDVSTQRADTGSERRERIEEGDGRRRRGASFMSSPTCYHPIHSLREFDPAPPTSCESSKVVASLRLLALHDLYRVRERGRLRWNGMQCQPTIAPSKQAATFDFQFILEPRRQWRNGIA